MPDPTEGFDRDSWETMIDEIIDKDGVSLSGWEAGFLESIRMRDALSDKQWACLCKIWSQKLG